MQRLLIADPSGMFGSVIAKQLKNEFVTECCCDGEQALELLRKFEPDIFVLNLQLPMVDGLTILRAMRGSGLRTKVIALTSLTDEYILRKLERLQVSMALMSTCRVSSVVEHIYSLKCQIKQNCNDEWSADHEADRILLNLGFRVGTASGCLMHAAVMYMYHNPGCYLTKSLYPDIAKEFGGTMTQVEKAIRDSISSAWKIDDQQIWKMYFPHNEKPSNEIFLGRISNALLQHERMKKHYDPIWLKAE